MTVTSTLWSFLAAVLIFLAIDLVWLGVVASRLYQHYMGHLLREHPNWPAALTFYLIFIAGLLWFAVRPGVADGSAATVALNAAIYGFVTYATFDLTSLAVLARFPLAIVPIDMAWGTILSTLVASGTFQVYQRWLA